MSAALVCNMFLQIPSEFHFHIKNQLLSMLPKITKHSKLSSLTLKFSITKVAALIAMQAGHCQQLLACHTSQSCARVLPKELGY